MKQLLMLSTLVTAILFAHPAYAQQHGNKKDSAKMHHMMQDSTKHNGMKAMCMNMMNGMMSMKNDSTHQDMTGDGRSRMCKKMCMNHMMQEDMDMNMNMNHMQKNGSDEKKDDKMSKPKG